MSTPDEPFASPSTGGSSALPPYGQPPQTGAPTTPPPPPYGQPAGGSADPSAYGQLPPAPPPYGQAGQAPYGPPGQAPYGQAGQSPYGQPPYGQAGQSPYGQAPSAYGPAGYPVSGGPWQGPPLAGWWRRVGGTLIDGIIGLIIQRVLIAIGRGVGGGAGSAIVALGTLAALAFAIWNLVRQGRTGQTVGKSALGTRLLREQDGQVVGAGLSIGRALLHILDLLPLLLGYLWPIWDDRKQTFADKIVHTVVIAA